MDATDRLILSAFDDPQPEPVQIVMPRGFWWKLGAIFAVGTTIGDIAAGFVTRALDCTFIYHCAHWWGP